MDKFFNIKNYLKEKNLDFMLFATYEDVNPNIFYFTGYVGAGFLIIFPSGEMMLHVPTRDLAQAKKVKNVTISSGKKLFEVLSERNLLSKNVGIDLQIFQLEILIT